METTGGRNGGDAGGGEGAMEHSLNNPSVVEELARLTQDAADSPLPPLRHQGPDGEFNLRLHDSLARIVSAGFELHVWSETGTIHTLEELQRLSAHLVKTLEVKIEETHLQQLVLAAPMSKCHCTSSTGPGQEQPGNFLQTPCTHEAYVVWFFKTVMDVFYWFHVKNVDDDTTNWGEMYDWSLTSDNEDERVETGVKQTGSPSEAEHALAQQQLEEATTLLEAERKAREVAESKLKAAVDQLQHSQEAHANSKLHLQPATPEATPNRVEYRVPKIGDNSHECVSPATEEDVPSMPDQKAACCAATCGVNTDLSEITCMIM